ncbi:unnamed protein product [Parnassius apollo]|uniref:(apollo) hypothetical protein n=1 Tax=Parnassius apollo TaxID=110799 RepID=A0A8S3W2K0_PARAO|nr:unnamed protein product [Parnassius apollo]
MVIIKSISNYAAVNVSNSTPPVVKTILDPKRRNDIVDEAFMEQKDVLLDMLETKLKEVRDKKKKKGDRGDVSNTTNFSNYNGDSAKCEPLPKNVDLKVNAHGISAIGETDVKLKFGETGPLFQRKACELINQTTTVSSATSSNPAFIDLKNHNGRRMNNDKFNNTVTLESNSTTPSKIDYPGLHVNSTEKIPLDVKQNNDTVNAVTPNLKQSVTPSNNTKT